MSKKVNFEGFSAEQMRFMTMLADPENHISQNEMAVELGVRPETLSRWKREPGFSEAMWELTLRNLESEISRVSAVLLKQALEGDIRSIRLFYEVVGRTGAQKTSVTCTREHVLSAQEVADGIRGILTERQLADYQMQMKRHYGIPDAFGNLYPHDFTSGDVLAVTEDVCLAVTS